MGIGNGACTPLQWATHVSVCSVPGRTRDPPGKGLARRPRSRRGMIRDLPAIHGKVSEPVGPHPRPDGGPRHRTELTMPAAAARTVVILGAGPAGLAAGFALSRAGWSVQVF